MTGHIQTIRRQAKLLLHNRDALALTEFAFSLPFMIVLGFGGVETANYAVTHMRISQVAVSLADNASRFKEEYNGNVPVLREYDINQGFRGAEKQAGGLDMDANGRMILSSLQYNETTKKQYIHWQRCSGKAKFNSSYGKEGDVVASGMGPTGRKISTESGYAIMFAEVYYNYQPLALGSFIPAKPIHKIAAMYVRDDRDLTQVNNSAGVKKSTCT